jgi:hypothetical protein
MLSLGSALFNNAVQLLKLYSADDRQIKEYGALAE